MLVGVVAASVTSRRSPCSICPPPVPVASKSPNCSSASASWILWCGLGVGSRAPPTRPCGPLPRWRDVRSRSIPVNGPWWRSPRCRCAWHDVDRGGHTASSDHVAFVVNKFATGRRWARDVAGWCPPPISAPVERPAAEGADGEPFADLDEAAPAFRRGRQARFPAASDEQAPSEVADPPGAVRALRAPPLAPVANLFQGAGGVPGPHAGREVDQRPGPVADLGDPAVGGVEDGFEPRRGRRGLRRVRRPARGRHRARCPPRGPRSTPRRGWRRSASARPPWARCASTPSSAGAWPPPARFRPRSRRGRAAGAGGAAAPRPPRGSCVGGPW